jgi:hypothetical protein
MSTQKRKIKFKQPDNKYSAIHPRDIFVFWTIELHSHLKKWKYTKRGKPSVFFFVCLNIIFNWSTDYMSSRLNVILLMKNVHSIYIYQPIRFVDHFATRPGKGIHTSRQTIWGKRNRAKLDSKKQRHYTVTKDCKWTKWRLAWYAISRSTWSCNWHCQYGNSNIRTPLYVYSNRFNQ